MERGENGRYVEGTGSALGWDGVSYDSIWHADQV